VHLPPLSTFRWWARRTGAVNAAVLEAAKEVLGHPVLDVLDPFAGGGTIPLVALRAGHRVQARDINPWAAEGMRRMLDPPEPAHLEAAYDVLGELVADTLRKAYATQMADGEPGTLAHTFRVAVGRCSACGTRQRQFPYSLLTLLQRRERKRPQAILACPGGHVFEGREDQAQDCPECGRFTDPKAFYTPRRFIECAECGHHERLSDRAVAAPWDWEVALVERACKGRREFSLPTAEEILQAEGGWEPAMALGSIPNGAETNVLLRHGFERWEDLYPARQRAVTETLLRLAEEASEDTRVVNALRMAVLGTTEFPGLLSRWDRFYLKCNDATAGHRFNFSTFVPELNVWGAGAIGRGTVTRRVTSLCKAAEWLQENVDGASAIVECGDSAKLENEGDVDLILTDPPYHDDVHYGELSLFFRAWAGLPMEDLDGEAATNSTAGLNAENGSYATALQPVFEACHRALRSQGRLVFSYANHEPRAWVALFAALQHAGFAAVSCVSVHSENETDFKKRGIRSCTDDLLMELSPVPYDEPTQGTARPLDGPFMDAVAELFLQVGTLAEDWEEPSLQILRDARATQREAEAEEVARSV
jgi:putative DNA methylase